MFQIVRRHGAMRAVIRESIAELRESWPRIHCGDSAFTCDPPGWKILYGPPIAGETCVRLVRQRLVPAPALDVVRSGNRVGPAPNKGTSIHDHAFGPSK